MTRRRFWLLAAANFAVALGYGAILPLLPTLLGALVETAAPEFLAWHTGGLLGSYMLGLFVSAPLWGVLSDRTGGRRLLVFGLCAYATTLGAFALSDSLAGAYAWRISAGVAGGAVLPVVNATIGAEANRRIRARHFAGTSMATLLGLLAGPGVSSLVYAGMEHMGDIATMTAAVIGLPLASAATFALSVAAGIGLDSSGGYATHAAVGTPRTPAVHWRQASSALFASFLALFGLGTFEAILPVLAPGALSLTPPALSALLALCMVVMLAVQAALILFPILHWAARGPFLAAGFVGLSGGVGILAQAGSPVEAATAVVLIGAGGAFLQPAIAYLATLNNAGASGALLGALTGAASLGQALGSVAGGALFAAFEANGLWVVAAALAGAAAWIGTSDPLKAAQRA